MGLRFLRMFPEETEYHLEARGGGWASLFGFPPRLFYYDREHYPEARTVWYLNGDTESAIEQVWAGRGLSGQLVKASQPATIAWCAARMGHRRSFFWYSAPGTVPGGADVELSAEYDALVEDALVANGVADDYRARMRAADHEYLYVREGGRIVSFCYLQALWPGIKEISGVFTRPECRGRGLGKRVVAAAQNRLAAQGVLSRYYVDGANAPSIALARSVGLAPILESRHYLA
jgi:ribosomal protein S18 acetylase RimI-like enzyme